MKKLALVFAAALALTACTAAPTETATIPAADPPAEAAATEENADAEQFPVGELRLCDDWRRDTDTAYYTLYGDVDTTELTGLKLDYADVDGFHIRTLILTMLYRLVPTLIEKGYVYIAESPLFEITTSDKTYFAYDENEKTKILKMIGNKKFDIQRSKGLGENEAEMMSLTTMDPATRRLIKIEPDDIEQTQWMFDMLLGDDLQGRKDFITNNGVDYLDMADIS